MAREPQSAPGRLTTIVAGWQARRIEDPVARLHFLRHSLGDRRVWDVPRLARQEWKRRKIVWAAAGCGLLLLPAGAWKGNGVLWDRAPVLTAQASERDANYIPSVWLVEQGTEREEYSNGLRIERRYETSLTPREYVVFQRGREDRGASAARTAPAGIVFHSTESAQTEFQPDQTRRMRIIGTALLEFVRQEHAYHYVVDRFGRVWRIVRESDIANHAGHSVWADRDTTYLNLNRSFLGISVEALTDPSAGQSQVTPAQVHALRVLTEMLRSKYRISAQNCVTHAQVSVNPGNMQAGYHYDWAVGFPYAQVGLPDNYAAALPSIWLFGFSYDPSLVKVTGEPFWRGLVLGEEQLRQNATAHGLSLEAYRGLLEKRYRQILSTLSANNVKAKEREG
ncbi:MAG: N-acetylmuramoyl-L-alanine amidase [Acidobacteria bacterium]|nr:N-acetylmuramoyl-L-alanine amidase [Acidobacteriota bacterium]